MYGVLWAVRDKNTFKTLGWGMSGREKGKYEANVSVCKVNDN